MTSLEPSNPVAPRFVAAINDGDRDAFLATLTPDATLTDDGNPRSLHDWIDREIFSARGRMNVEREEKTGSAPRPIPQRHLGRDVHLLALRGDRGHDQPHRHRPGLSLRADIPVCDNAILKVKCRPPRTGRAARSPLRIDQRVRPPRSGRSASRRLLPDP
jgi:hypothetical protein